MDADLVVTEGGGSDFIYVPADLTPGKPALHRDLVSKVVGWLVSQDYVSGVFVDDSYCRHGQFPGALPLSRIGLVGSAAVPRPAVGVSFRSFSLGPEGDWQHGVLVADTDRRQGEGDHGAFDRSDTFNFMAAWGPDFKRAYTDPAPVSNADIAHTLAAVLGLPAQRQGKLAGRAITEALAGMPDADPAAIQRGTEPCTGFRPSWTGSSIRANAISTPPGSRGARSGWSPEIPRLERRANAGSRDRPPDGVRV